ncbi:hypothetical protein FOL47_001011, partial [Perkinsus chesapeaki]
MSDSSGNGTPIPSSDFSTPLSVGEIAAVRELIGRQLGGEQNNEVLQESPNEKAPYSLSDTRRSVLYIAEERKFQSKEEAHTYLEARSGQRMTSKGGYPTKDGTFVWRYQCSLVGKSEPECHYTAQIRRSRGEWTVCLPQPPHHRHVHRGNAVSSRSILSEAAKTVIMDQMKARMKPRETTSSLRARELIPEEDTVTRAKLKKAVYNARAYMKRSLEKSEEGTGYTVASIRVFAEAHSETPDDQDKAFCLDYTIVPGGFFYFVFSCVRLLRENSSYNVITCDYTAAPNWLGLPLLVLGAIDSYGHFRALGFAITSDETWESVARTFRSIQRHAELLHCRFDPQVLIADRADAFSRAFRETFGPTSPTGLTPQLRWCHTDFTDRTRLYCWVHMLRSVRGWCSSYINTKTEGSAKSASSKRGDFYRDLKVLHCCGSDSLFEDAVNLLKKKWHPTYPSLWDKLEATWLRSWATWYVGAHGVLGSIPRHSCAVEGINSSVKG